MNKEMPQPPKKPHSPHELHEYEDRLAWYADKGSWEHIDADYIDSMYPNTSLSKDLDMLDEAKSIDEQLRNSG